MSNYGEFLSLLEKIVEEIKINVVYLHIEKCLL